MLEAEHGTHIVPSIQDPTQQSAWPGTELAFPHPLTLINLFIEKIVRY